MPARGDSEAVPAEDRRARSHDLTLPEARWENEGGADGDQEQSALCRADFQIDPVRPFRLDLSVWALRRRPRNTVDLWDGTSYGRALALADATVEVSVTQADSRNAPSLDVTLTGERLDHRTQEDARPSIERLLGLRVDLSSFYRMAEADNLIGPIATRFRGLKPPRFPTVFESLLNAVACQQLSLEAGLSLLNRLAATYGETVPADQTSPHAFPRPAHLADLEPQALRQLGFSARKATTIIEVSRAAVAGNLEGLEHDTDDEVVSRLTSLSGIGRWSAEYVLLRGLGRLHIFPGDDVGARNNLARRLRLTAPLDYHAVAKAVSRWQPYAGLVYFHLLLDRLETAGELEITDAATPL